METQKVENKSLLQGNNEFETGVLTISAEGTVPAGALLARGAAGKFQVITDTGATPPVVVNPVELKNPGTAQADIAFRALIGGRVRFDMLSVGSQGITDAQADMLRQYGIIAKKVTDISRTE